MRRPGPTALPDSGLEDVPRAVAARLEKGAAASGAEIAGMIGPAGAVRPEPLRGAAESPGAAPVAAAPLLPAAILHVDIDAFFASIEQLRDPRLAGKPVIVGAGVIASCSYEARRHGLRAGMRLSEARRRCPHVVVLEGHAQIYRCFAERVFELCREFSPAVESLLDEAYCDLSGTERLHGDLLEAASRLKQRIRSATGLTVTCGLGPNRMLAKMAGKLRRPDGLQRLAAHEAETLLPRRPIEDVPGVGHAHARSLRSMNVTTIAALRALPIEVLAALFGAPGRLLYERCRGRDTAVVHEREIPLSISRETSFHRPTADPAEIEGMLDYLLGRAARTARELGLKARTITLRLRYTDGEGDERACSLPQPSDADAPLLEHALELLRRSFTRRVPLHLVGISLSRFISHAAEQGSLFDPDRTLRQSALYRAFDQVRGEFGHGVLISGRALDLKGRLPEDRHGFVLRTPSLTR